MRVLLDECLLRRLKRELLGHDVARSNRLDGLRPLMRDSLKCFKRRSGGR